MNDDTDQQRATEALTACLEALTRLFVQKRGYSPHPRELKQRVVDALTSEFDGQTEAIAVLTRREISATKGATVVRPLCWVRRAPASPLAGTNDRHGTQIATQP